MPNDEKTSREMSKYGLPAKEWDGRPLQTGMEQKHERWVLDMVNFLNTQNIPAVERDRFGDRVRGGTYDLSHRIILLGDKIAVTEKRLRDSEHDLYQERKKREQAEDLLKAARAEVEDPELAAEIRKFFGEEETDG